MTTAERAPASPFAPSALVEIRRQVQIDVCWHVADCSVCTDQVMACQTGRWLAELERDMTSMLLDGAPCPH